MRWSPEQIPDQSGRVALVTGVTGGLGFHTALELARKGAQVVLAARDESAAHAAGEEIRGQVPGAVLPVLGLDLAELSSVRRAAELALQQWPTIDLLVNNAGVMATPNRKTADGFELQLGTNHLGHFALTGLLLPALHTARVVTVSSFMHAGARRVPDIDLRTERRYRRWTAYSESKLANLMFMLELHRRARAAQLDLVSVGAHPGYASTRLVSSGPRLGTPGPAAYLLAGATRLLGQSAAAGAWPILMAATMPKLPGGTYVGPSGRFELRGRPEPVDMSPVARDAEAAAALWVRSEEATGVRCLSGPPL